jgi:hypothetical protein
MKLNAFIDDDRDDPFENSDSEGDVAKHKILQTKAKCGFLLRRLVEGDSVPKYFKCWAHIPSWPQGMDATNADVMTACHDSLVVMEADAAIDSRYARKVDIIIIDQHSANFRKERFQKLKHPSRTQLIQVCNAHDKARVQKEGYKVTRPFDRNAIRAALTLKGPIKKKSQNQNAANLGRHFSHYRRRRQHTRSREGQTIKTQIILRWQNSNGQARTSNRKQNVQW